MGMVTISQYAKANGISFQAVNQMIKRYQPQLEGHITTQGKSRYLDDEATAFLNAHRRSTPVTVIDKNNMQEIEVLREQNKELLTKLNTAYEEIIASQNKYTALLEQHTELKLSIEAKEQPTEAPNAEGAEVPTDNQKTQQTATEEATANRFIRAWKELWK